MTHREFVLIVLDMRSAQERFIDERSQENLDAAQEFEEAVDKEVKAFLNVQRKMI